jgi:hypothetical protein
MGGSKMYDLGAKAKDKITGFEGIITARCEYLSGDNQYFIEAPAKDGKSENAWVVEDRLVVLAE